MYRLSGSHRTGMYLLLIGQEGGQYIYRIIKTKNKNMKILIILSALASMEILLLKVLMLKKLIPLDTDGTLTERAPLPKSKRMHRKH